MGENLVIVRNGSEFGFREDGEDDNNDDNDDEGITRS